MLPVPNFPTLPVNVTTMPPRGPFRHMEIVTDPFAVVNRGGLNGAGVARPADDKILGRRHDLMHGVQIVVLEVHQYI